MTEYRRESHLRSLIKGLTWRFVATTDTILVVLLVTCSLGQCSLENAIAIGMVEFVVKFVVYYLHERLWQLFRSGPVTHRRTIFKSISWRLVATTQTFIISGAVLDRFDEVALYIALVELFTKFVLYYLHERLWLRLPVGRIRNWFYRTILRRR
jgi:uncharacterized membrane protein